MPRVPASLPQHLVIDDETLQAMDPDSRIRGNAGRSQIFNHIEKQCASFEDHLKQHYASIMSAYQQHCIAVTAAVQADQCGQLLSSIPAMTSVPGDLTYRNERLPITPVDTDCAPLAHSIAASDHQARENNCVHGSKANGSDSQVPG